MSGKLPIDRVREAEDAPRIYEDHRQRFSEKQAKLRDIATAPAPAETTSDADNVSTTPARAENVDA